jgi:hypothetical protein
VELTKSYLNKSAESSQNNDATEFNLTNITSSAEQNMDFTDTRDRTQNLAITQHTETSSSDSELESLPELEFLPFTNNSILDILDSPNSSPNTISRRIGFNILMTCSPVI